MCVCVCVCVCVYFSNTAAINVSSRERLLVFNNSSIIVSPASFSCKC